MLSHCLKRNRIGIVKVLTRSITIQQPTSSIVHTPTELSKAISSDITKSISSNIEEFPKINSSSENELKEDPIFETIGTPQSTLSITVPPSVPIHVKRGSLLTLFTGSSNNAESKQINSVVSSVIDVKEPIRRFLYGGLTSTYQKLVSTVPLNLLVSAYNNGGTNNLTSSRYIESTKTFCNVTLDGTVDWAVLDPKSLHVYTGNSLLITSQKFPKTLSKEAMKKNQLDKDSLPGLRSFFQTGYTLLSGRGFVSLVGSGTIFKLNLTEGEEISIKKGNLLGCTIKEQSEFNDGHFIAQNLSKRPELNEKSSEIIINPDEAPSQESTWNQITEFVGSTYSKLSKASNSIYDSIIGNGGYLRIKGPRTLLIQTNSGLDQYILSSQLSNNKISSIDKFIKDKTEFKQPEVTKGDNLSVVTISNGKIEYKNTPDFQQEVNRIESMNKQK